MLSAAAGLAAGAPGSLCISAAAVTAVEVKPKTDLVLIPGGKGKATRMKKGETIKIINTNGTQVWVIAYA